MACQLKSGTIFGAPAKAAAAVIAMLLAGIICGQDDPSKVLGQALASRPSTGRAAPGAAPTSSPTTRPGYLCVATYNINYGNPDLKAIVETVHKFRADVLAIQEFNSESQEFLDAQLGDEYKFRYEHPANFAGGFAIFSRLEVKDVHYLPSQGSFETQVGRIDWDGKKVQLVNVHLCPTLPKDAKNLKVVMETFAKAEEVRNREIQFIFKSIKADVPTIMLGDFNSFSNMSAIEFMMAKKYIDSFASVTAVPDIHQTWHWPSANHPNNEWKFRLDYVLHTPDFQTTGSRVILAGPSDHYPVVSELKAASRPATASAPAATTPDPVH